MRRLRARRRREEARQKWVADELQRLRDDQLEELYAENEDSATKTEQLDDLLSSLLRARHEWSACLSEKNEWKRLDRYAARSDELPRGSSATSQIILGMCLDAEALAHILHSDLPARPRDRGPPEERAIERVPWALLESATATVGLGSRRR